MSVGVQPLLSASAAPADDDSSSHPRPQRHRAESPLPQLQLQQQDVPRVHRTADHGRRRAALQATPSAGRPLRPPPARRDHVTTRDDVTMTSPAHVTSSLPAFL